MKITSFFKIFGVLSITVRDKNNSIVYEEHLKNTMLDSGKSELISLLWNNSARETTSGASSVVRSLCRFAIGDGGCPSASLNTPKTPSKTRTGLYNEVWRLDIPAVTTTKPTANSLEFEVSIDSSSISLSDYNPSNGGPYINEAGIVSSIPGVYTPGNPTSGAIGADDALINIKTFKSFPFDPSLGLVATFKWRLYIIL